MKLAYLRQFSHTLPTYRVTEDGPDLIHSTGRIGMVPVIDNEGNTVESEVLMINTEQAIHDIIAEWVGYEQLPWLEEESNV